MECFQAIQARYSTRSFTDQPIPRDQLEQLVTAGLRAPTARNEQPWAFVIVTDAPTRRQIAKQTEFGKFIAEAPACIVVFCRETKYYLEDGCAAVENILLAATDLGIQSCWVAGDKKDYALIIAQMLGAPDEYKTIAYLALGYAKSPGQPKERKPLNEVLHWEKW